jgi:ABC-type nitrate/sulfonate/bicarbonate transport system ATPase subunit
VNAPLQVVPDAGAVPARSASVLSLRQVALALGGRPVLAHLDLEVGQGEVVALLGRSGSGKTTLLRLAAGLLRPDHGEVRGPAVLGPGVAPAPGADLPGSALSLAGLDQRGQAMVFQDARLLPWLTLGGNLELVSPRARHPEIAGWLARVGLAGLAGAYPDQLSLGMAQRAALARALLLRPRLLLLDEPHSALDELTAAELRTMLGTLLAESGSSALLVTHNPAEAAELADRVVVLGGQPARVQAEYRLTAPRPRQPDDPRLWSEVLALRALLRQVDA